MLMNHHARWWVQENEYLEASSAHWKPQDFVPNLTSESSELLEYLSAYELPSGFHQNEIKQKEVGYLGEIWKILNCQTKDKSCFLELYLY